MEVVDNVEEHVLDAGVGQVLVVQEDDLGEPGQQLEILRHHVTAPAHRPVTLKYNQYTHLDHS